MNKMKAQMRCQAMTGRCVSMPVTTQNGDTVISVADEMRLILENSDDELDITQFDIY